MFVVLKIEKGVDTGLKRCYNKQAFFGKPKEPRQLKMRMWWNWQTRMIQVHMPTSMQVQVLSSAPGKSLEPSGSRLFVLLL